MLGREAERTEKKAMIGEFGVLNLISWGDGGGGGGGDGSEVV